MWLSLCLFVCLFVCLSVCLSACLFVCLSSCLSAYLSVRVSICVCVCVSACLSVCLSMHLPNRYPLFPDYTKIPKLTKNIPCIQIYLFHFLFSAMQHVRTTNRLRLERVETLILTLPQGIKSVNKTYQSWMFSGLRSVIRGYRLGRCIAENKK